MLQENTLENYDDIVEISENWSPNDSVIKNPDIKNIPNNQKELPLLPEPKNINLGLLSLKDRIEIQIQDE